MAGAMITDLGDARKFILSGQAKFTLVSKKSGERKTFRVRAAEDKDDFWFVDLLVGPDNGSDYKYLACISKAGSNLYLKINRTCWGEESFKAFDWLLRRTNYHQFCIGAQDALAENASFAERAELWHSGTCGRCGRELTDPESIARGLGPVCAGEV